MTAAGKTIPTADPAPPGGTPPGCAARDALLLAQWLSPAFPIGGFACSQGLEVAMADGRVRDAAALADWVAMVLEHGSGWSDGILLAHARTPGADLAALADLAVALAPSAERLAETLDQGAAFGAMAAAAQGMAPPAPLPYPLAVGRATRALAVGSEQVLGLWLMALAAQLTSAAVRFVPLGQGAGQRVLADLAPLAAALAPRIAAATLDDIATATPGADLASMAHETLQPRIFRT